MSDELLIRCCAPTLAAIKTGSLFNCAFEDEDDLRLSLRAINTCLRTKGVCALPLSRNGGKALIYVYRPAMLAQDLADPLAKQILSNCGYADATPARCISTLINRLNEYSEFPHEIGLFLGYPPVDVRGFMERRPCKYTGLWKVYESDEEEAKRFVKRCHNCTRAYLHRKQQGWDLSRLTVKPRQFSYNISNNSTERKETA